MWCDRIKILKNSKNLLTNNTKCVIIITEIRELINRQNREKEFKYESNKDN